MCTYPVHLHFYLDKQAEGTNDLTISVEGQIVRLTKYKEERLSARWSLAQNYQITLLMVKSLAKRGVWQALWGKWVILIRIINIVNTFP